MPTGVSVQQHAAALGPIKLPHQHLASSDAVDPERKPINRCAINWFQFVKLIERRSYPS